MSFVCAYCAKRAGSTGGVRPGPGHERDLLVEQQVAGGRGPWQRWITTWPGVNSDGSETFPTNGISAARFT